VRPEILRGGTRQAQNWLDLLPDDALDQHPRLLLELCLLGVMRDQADLVDLVTRTEAALASARMADREYRTAQSELYFFKICVQYFQRNLDNVRNLVRDAGQYMGDVDPELRGIFAFLQMQLAWLSGEGRSAQGKGNQAIKVLRDAGFDQVVIAVRREQAWILAQCGSPQDALVMLQEIVDSAQANRSVAIRELVSTHVIAAAICYWMDDIEGAQRAQESAFALAKRLADHALMREIGSLAVLFAMARATGRSSEIEDSWPIGENSSHPLLNRMHIHQLVRQGQIERAWYFAAALGLIAGGEISTSYLPDLVAILEVIVAREIDLEIVTPQIAAAIEEAERADNQLYAAQLYALSAWANLQMGRREQAERALVRALDLAVDTGYVRFILDIPALGPLLASLDHPAAAELWFATVPEALRRQAAQLTNQERLVLAHLSQPARYQDIADNLGISINTVRTHIRHIYRKLGVSKREEAVARARALGLTAQDDLIPNVYGR